MVVFILEWSAKNKAIVGPRKCGRKSLVWRMTGLPAQADDDRLGRMDITLTGHFKSFIAEQLQGGRYQDAGDVVRAALRELERAELKRSLADFDAAFRKADRHAPKGEPSAENLSDLDRIIKAHRATRRQKRTGR